MNNRIICTLTATLVACLCIVSCGKKPKDMKYGDGIHSEMIGKKIINSSLSSMTRKQFDAYCDSLKIPSQINSWMVSGFKDYETGSTIINYAWYDQNQNDSDGIANRTFVLGLKITSPSGHPDTLFNVEQRNVMIEK